MLNDLFVERFNVTDAAVEDGDTVMHDAGEIGRRRATLPVPPREGHMQCKERLFLAALRKMKDNNIKITAAAVRKQFEKLRDDEEIVDRRVALTTRAIETRLQQLRKV
jgi:hypothetical protein